MKNTLAAQAAYYMEHMDFPQDAVQDILCALDRLAENAECFAEFCQLIETYRQTESDWHFTPVIDANKALCARAGVQENVGMLLMFLCMADAMRAHYRARGIDEEIFWNSLADLRHKLIEARLIYGVNGNYHPAWQSGFFKLRLFALGRLQFEISTMSRACECDGNSFPEGAKAISVHIPRTGTRLLHEEVLASYRRAKEFFKEEFAGGPTLFTCASWLLDPWNMTVLSPTSNLRAFCNDYQLVSSGHYPDYSQLWRLFDCEYTGDPDALPQDSSLRRAYVARIKRGEPTGYARGVFVMK